MATLLPQKPEQFPEPSTIEFSISVLIHRISTLPKEDRDDLYRLVKELGSVSCSDEIESIRQAMMEILDQRDGKIEELDLTPGTGTPNGKWKKFISEKIKSERVEKGWTQDELAARSGIPQSHLSRIENGVHSPSRKTVEKIAAALEVPVAEFDPSFDD